MNEQEIRAIVRDEIAKAASGPGYDPTGEGSAWQGEAPAKSAGLAKFVAASAVAEAPPVAWRPGSPCANPIPANEGDSRAAESLADRVSDSIADDVQRMQVAIETLTDERDRLRDQVARLQEERDAAVGRAVLAERARAELLADLQGILQEVPPATNGKPTP